MRIFLTTAAIALMVGLAPAAEAACAKTGTVVRVKMRDDSKSGNHVIYLREFAWDNYYYTVKTQDDDMLALAGTMVANRTRVRIKGSVSSCPATPASGGFATIGKVIDFFAAP